MTASGEWRTLRELDREAGVAKGAAFRAFKALEPGLREGVDFRQLDPARDSAGYAALRKAGRLYPASPRPLLLNPALAARILAALAR